MARLLRVLHGSKTSSCGIKVFRHFGDQPNVLYATDCHHQTPGVQRTFVFRKVLLFSIPSKFCRPFCRDAADCCSSFFANNVSSVRLHSETFIGNFQHALRCLRNCSDGYKGQGSYKSYAPNRAKSEDQVRKPCLCHSIQNGQSRIEETARIQLATLMAVVFVQRK
jgi:hypothetical protein